MSAETFHDKWTAKVAARHDEEVAAGKHDDLCEWRPAGYYLCHCSKRAREREGYTEPPGELIHRGPLCPRCYYEAEFDGDGWRCQGCKVQWGERMGDAGTFTDDYGDLDPDGWERRNAEAAARKNSGAQA